MEYKSRLADRLLPGLLAEFPAILLVGPRACGKTTTASRHAASVVRLDRPAEAAAFVADPDAALGQMPEPVLLDEWQVVPEVLGAVKRAVDRGSGPGRFLLAGSVSSELEGWWGPATGRVLRLHLAGFAVREQLGRIEAAPFLDRVASGAPLGASRDTPDLPGYLALALRGGFPEPLLRLSPDAGARWMRSYLSQLTRREVNGGVGGGHDPAKFDAFVQALALNSAGTPQDKTLHEAAGVSRPTAISYGAFLQQLHLLDLVPAWAGNRTKRLVRAPKRYLTDPGLMGAALGLDLAAVMRDGDLIGRLLDTFVVAQLRAELELSTGPMPRLHHLRTEQGRREIDLVVEMGGGRVIGIEVKAAAAPKLETARHLAWLRDSLGDRFVAGVVLHTGSRTWSLGERITAAPISSIWAEPG